MSTFLTRQRAHAPVLSILLALALMLTIPACGSSGGSEPVYGGQYEPLVITSASLPAAQSGETIDYEIQLAGGCGGPYVVQVISGLLPKGMGTDDAAGRHHITGILLEDGNFNFSLQVTDTSCTPFLTTTQTYAWPVTEGPLQIVGTYPAWTPAGENEDPSAWPDADTLPKTVYGQFMNTNFIVAGGKGPYRCQVIEDQDDPDDGALPLGASMPSDGVSITGTPVEVGPGGRPFRLTIAAADSTGQTITRKVQWKVDTPQLIISNAVLADGKAGGSYSDLIQVADGVPPFAYELLDDVPSVPDDEITYDSPNAPTFPSDSGFTVSPTGEADNKLGDGSTATYPSSSDVGPTYSPFPPEGVYMDEGTGSIVGLPRRSGDYTVFVHAYSTLVPNERGQHSFRDLTFHIDPSEPPTIGVAFGFDYSFTTEGVAVPGPAYSTLPEFEIGQTYNPDAGSHADEGLQLLGVGGVAADGLSDGAHASQVSSNGELAGTYLWQGDWDVDDLSPLSPPPPGIAMEPAAQAGYSNGVIYVSDEDALIRQSRELAEFTCIDFQLPDSRTNDVSDKFGYSVGPDVVIITHSSRSLSQTANYWSAAQRHDWDVHEMTIKKFQGFTSGPVLSPLDMADLTEGTFIPPAAGLSAATNQLGALISGVTLEGTTSTGGAPDLDLLRCTIVATGWGDDIHGLNPKGGRAFQHADANKGYAYYGQFGNSYSNHGNYQPSVSCVDLPDAEGVTANTSNGVFIDGGRLYHFDSATHFGAYVIRTDGSIYVPFAYKKDSTYDGFGDGILQAKGTGKNSALRTVQMTISPDGRFAAMKLKQKSMNFYENASFSGIVLFSLTGEKAFGSNTYVIAGSGAGLTGAGNRILHASSMALTNDYLYFLIGSTSANGTSTSYTPMYYQSWRGHYLMRYKITGGASAASLLPSADLTDSNWTQQSGTSMQTTYQHHGPDWSTSYPMWESTTTYGLWPYHRYWQEDGMNLHENGVAPTPFRVSANGEAVAFMAGSDPGTTTYSTLVYSNYAWVDYAGSGARRATTTRRHCYAGSGRGYTLSHGPNEYCMWGRYSGPTTGFEISDDGLSLAFAYNTNPNSIYSTQSYSSSSHSWMRYRDNVHLCSTTASDKWATLTSTVQDSVTASVFTGSHRWRFGSLAFTADGDGLVFWAGAPFYQANSTSYTYNQSYQLAGTYYIHNLGSTNSVRGMCATLEGGNGTTTYTSSSPFSPSATAGTSSSGNQTVNARYGAIQPMGGFMSKNREMLYIVSYGALSTSDATACKLLGLNIKSTPNTGTVNTTHQHKNGEAFLLTDWPTRRGFIGNYIYYPYYPLYYGYAPGKKQGLGMQVMAKDNGWVFWGANYQYTGPGNYYNYGGPPWVSYYYGAYGYGGTGIYGFNADLGGTVKQLNDPADTPNSTSSTSYSKHHHIEVTADGSRLALTRSYYYYYDYHNQERITSVRNIDFSTAGSGEMHAAFDNTDPADYKKIENSNGRAGESMAFSTSNPNELWYSYKVGASNENAQEIVRAKFDPSAGTWSFTRFSSLPGRYSTLYATR